MTKDQVIKIRDLFHDRGIRVIIFGDNSMLLNERYDIIVWDDDNELLYAMNQAKTSSPTEEPRPEISTYYTILGYDVIQYIQASSTFNQFESIIDKIPVNDDERKSKIIDHFAKVNGKTILAKPGTRTLEQIKQESPELYNSVMNK